MNVYKDYIFIYTIRKTNCPLEEYNKKRGLPKACLIFINVKSVSGSTFLQMVFLLQIA